MEERLQTEQNAAVQEDSAFLRLLYALKRFWVLILLMTLVGLGLGFGYAELKVKPVYTASKSVMFIVNATKIDSSSATSGNGSSNNATLAKRYLPDAAVYITSDLFVKKDNEFYSAAAKENPEIYGTDPGSISRGAISVSYSDNSLIFSISYSDSTENAAKLKLDKVIEGSNFMIVNSGEEDSEIKGLIMGEDMELKPTQTYATVSVRNGNSRMIVIGAILGLVVGLAIVLLIYLLDNTVKDMRELERLTGSNVIAYLENVKS